MIASGGACKGLRSQTACLADGLGAPTMVVVGGRVSRGKGKGTLQVRELHNGCKGLQLVAELKRGHKRSGGDQPRQSSLSRHNRSNNGRSK